MDESLFKAPAVVETKTFQEADKISPEYVQGLKGQVQRALIDLEERLNLLKDDADGKKMADGLQQQAEELQKALTQDIAQIDAKTIDTVGEYQEIRARILSLHSSLSLSTYEDLEKECKDDISDKIQNFSVEIENLSDAYFGKKVTFKKGSGDKILRNGSGEKLFSLPSGVDYEVKVLDMNAIKVGDQKFVKIEYGGANFFINTIHLDAGTNLRRPQNPVEISETVEAATAPREKFANLQLTDAKNNFYEQILAQIKALRPDDNNLYQFNLKQVPTDTFAYSRDSSIKFFLDDGELVSNLNGAVMRFPPTEDDFINVVVYGQERANDTLKPKPINISESLNFLREGATGSIENLANLSLLLSKLPVGQEYVLNFNSLKIKVRRTEGAKYSLFAMRARDDIGASAQTLTITDSQDIPSVLRSVAKFAMYEFEAGENIALDSNVAQKITDPKEWTKFITDLPTKFDTDGKSLSINLNSTDVYTIYCRSAANGLYEIKKGPYSEQEAKSSTYHYLNVEQLIGKLNEAYKASWDSMSPEEAQKYAESLDERPKTKINFYKHPSLQEYGVARQTRAEFLAYTASANTAPDTRRGNGELSKYPQRDVNIAFEHLKLKTLDRISPFFEDAKDGMLSRRTLKSLGVEEADLPALNSVLDQSNIALPLYEKLIAYALKLDLKDPNASSRDRLEAAVFDYYKDSEISLGLSTLLTDFTKPQYRGPILVVDQKESGPDLKAENNPVLKVDDFSTFRKFAISDRFRSKHKREDAKENSLVYKRNLKETTRAAGTAPQQAVKRVEFTFPRFAYSKEWQEGDVIKKGEKKYIILEKPDGSGIQMFKFTDDKGMELFVDSSTVDKRELEQKMQALKANFEQSQLLQKDLNKQDAKRAAIRKMVGDYDAAQPDNQNYSSRTERTRADGTYESTITETNPDLTYRMTQEQLNDYLQGTETGALEKKKDSRIVDAYFGWQPRFILSQKGFEITGSKYKGQTVVDEEKKSAEQPNIDLLKRIPAANLHFIRKDMWHMKDEMLMDALSISKVTADKLRNPLISDPLKRYFKQYDQSEKKLGQVLAMKDRIKTHYGESSDVYRAMNVFGDTLVEAKGRIGTETVDLRLKMKGNVTVEDMFRIFAQIDLLKDKTDQAVAQIEAKEYSEREKQIVGFKEDTIYLTRQQKKTLQSAQLGGDRHLPCEVDVIFINANRNEVPKHFDRTQCLATMDAYTGEFKAIYPINPKTKQVDRTVPGSWLKRPSDPNPNNFHTVTKVKRSKV